MLQGGMYQSYAKTHLATTIKRFLKQIVLMHGQQTRGHYFMQIAALIARGTTLQEIASETGQSIQYVRWWCKEKLSEKTFSKLIENRKAGLNG